MKVNEVIGKKPVVVQPTLTQQQQRVGKVLQRSIASDQQQPPTEMDAVMAMRQHADMKKQTDRSYAAKLKQQLASAEERLSN